MKLSVKTLWMLVTVTLAGCNQTPSTLEDTERRAFSVKCEAESRTLAQTEGPKAELRAQAERRADSHNPEKMGNHKKDDVFSLTGGPPHRSQDGRGFRRSGLTIQDCGVQESG